MSDALPPDPFGPPDDMVTMMKGLSHLHSAGMMAGLSEAVMTQFISNVFVALSLMQNAQQAPEET